MKTALSSQTNTSKFRGIRQRLLVALLATVPLLGLAPSPGMAQQVTPVDPLQDFQNPEASSDPFSGSGSNQTQGVFGLIHRANFGTLRPMPAYINEQRQTIEIEASDFRSRQLQLIQNANQAGGDTTGMPNNQGN